MVEKIDIELLELNGDYIFPLRGASGGLAPSYISYLIARHNNIEYSFPIEMIPKKGTEIKNFNTGNMALFLIENLDKFKELFYLKIMNSTANVVNFSGGDLGRAFNNGLIIEV